MLLPLLTILLAACGSDEPEATGSQAGNATISLSDSELSVGYEAQTLPVTVRSSADWSVSSNVDWITVSPSGGLKDRDTEISIKVKENDTHEQRVGTVTIKAGSSSAAVTVTQTPDMYFNVGKASYSIGAKAQTIVIPIESNQSWTASSVSTWLTIDTPAGNGSGSCSISVQENDTPRERTATIEFVTASGARTPVDITQFTDAIDVPDGYALVWNDEFNDESSLTEKWTYEVWVRVPSIMSCNAMSQGNITAIRLPRCMTASLPSPRGKSAVKWCRPVSIRANIGHTASSKLA